jgi:type IV pilus assembly protein PilO
MKKQPWVTFALLAAALVGLVYLLYLKPKQKELEAIRTERIAVEAQVEDLRAKKRQLDAINAELVVLTRSLAELESVLPRKREQSDILRNFQQMAYDQRLELIRFGGAEREILKDFYSEWPIPIEVAGTYHSLGRFFDRLLHFPRLFIIDDFAIRTVPNQTDEFTVSAVFTAKTFFFLEESLIKKPEGDKPRRPVVERDEY